MVATVIGAEPGTPHRRNIQQAYENRENSFRRISIKSWTAQIPKLLTIKSRGLLARCGT